MRNKCIPGDVDAIQRMIDELGIESILNAKDPQGNHRTCLHYAAYFGRVDLVKLLVKQKVDLEQKDDNDWTAMHYAASRNQ